MDLQQIRELLNIFDESSVAVMDLEEGNLKIHLEKEPFDPDEILMDLFDDYDDDDYDDCDDYNEESA